MNYVLGSMGFTTNAYSFSQISACGYTETIQIYQSLPTGVTHNVDNKTFTITDSAVVGTYSVTVISRIVVFVDISKNT